MIHFFKFQQMHALRSEAVTSRHNFHTIMIGVLGIIVAIDLLVSERKSSHLFFG